MAEPSHRAAIYARTPPVPEPGIPRTLAEQIHLCKEHCVSKGYTPVYVYAEVGSANDTDRKSLTTALADAKAGKFDRLVIHDFFRLARNGDLLQRIISQCEQGGVAVESITEDAQLTSMIAAIQEKVAQVKRERLSARRRAGRQRSGI